MMNLIKFAIMLSMLFSIGAVNSVYANTNENKEAVKGEKEPKAVSIPLRSSANGQNYLDISGIPKTSLNPKPSEYLNHYITNLNPEDRRNDPITGDRYNWAVFTRHQGSEMDQARNRQPSTIISITGVSYPEVPVVGSGQGSFIRRNANTFESYIDSRTFPFYQIRGGGPNNVYSLEIKSDAVGTGMSGKFKMPKMELEEGAVQLSFIAYLYNKKDERQNPIALVNLIANSKEENLELAPYTSYDSRSFFASQKIDSGRYATPISENEMTAKAFADERLYGFVLTKENIRNILMDLKRSLDMAKANGRNVPVLDEDVNNYQVSLVGIMHEVFTLNNPDNDVASGMSVKDLTVFKLNNSNQ